MRFFSNATQRRRTVWAVSSPFFRTIAGVFAATLAGVAAGQSYTLTALPTNGSTEVVCTGVNSLGHVVGWYALANGDHQAFIWTGGSTLTPLSSPGESATAEGLNDNDEVVGYYDTPPTGKTQTVYPVALYWSSTGQYTVLGPTNSATEATGINNSGEICGYEGNSKFTGAAIWKQSSKNWTEYSIETGETAYRINASGQMVYFGPAANVYLWTPKTANGTTTGANILLGGNPPAGLNDAGQAVFGGQVYLPTAADGLPAGMTTIPSLPAEGSINMFAESINSSLQVVGGENTGGSVTFTWIWDPVNGTRNIATLVDSSGAGWNLAPNPPDSFARAINNNGQIAGTGIDPSGNVHAYLLNPIVSPQRR